MKTELLTTIDELQRLKEAWTNLCDELQAGITPFSSYEWYEVWWRHYSAGETLHLFVMWDAGRLVGIAPLMLRRATLHGLSAKAICFIENNQSFHNDFIILPNYREIFLRELVKFLFKPSSKSKWEILALNKLSTFSPNYRLLSDIIHEMGIKSREEQVVDARYIIPVGTWSEYLGSRSVRTRKTLRNIQNSLQKAGSVSVRNIRTYEEFQEVAEEVFAVARGSWTEGLGDSMGSPVNHSFFKELTRVAAEKGWLSLWSLSLDGKMIAIEYHLRSHGKEFAMRGHYLPEYGKFSPGTFLEMQVMKSIFEEPERLEKYDLGNFYSYKQKWSDASEPHLAISIFNDRPYSRLLSFHESKTVPMLRRIIPKGFWDNRIFRICGINTKPFQIKQH